MLNDEHTKAESHISERRPTRTPASRATDDARMAKAIVYLAHRRAAPPSLEQVVRHVGLSPDDFQRRFVAAVGISPKQFLKSVTLEAARVRLGESVRVLDAAWDVGLSGAGHLQDLFVSVDAMTPGEYQCSGGGLNIHFGFHPSPFGEALLLATQRGICGLGFVTGSREQTLEELCRPWPRAKGVEDPDYTRNLATRCFDRPPTKGRQDPLRLLLKGTPFQLKVWQALLRVPPGCVTSYADLAGRLGAPGAARAVGNANAANAVAYLIPCHRVIRSTGALGGYRWDTDRKLAMLGYEAANQAPA